MDYIPPDSSVYEISQAITLEWVAIPFSRGRFPTQGSKLHHPCKWLLYHWAIREALKSLRLSSYSQSESETTEATGNLRWFQSTWQFWLISKIVREGDSKSFSTTGIEDEWDIYAYSIEGSFTHYLRNMEEILKLLGGIAECLTPITLTK